MMKQRRSGWTLFELMVAMAVIVIIGAIAAPSLTNSYSSYRLKSAADGISAAFAKARSKAMRTGCAYRVSIMPETGNYRIAPENPDAMTNKSAQPADPLVVEDHLPDGVQISIGSTTPSDPTNPTANLGSSVGASDTGSYIVAAVFQADGSARNDVQVVLTMKGTAPMTVKLRGMTGSVTMETQAAGASHS
jgi:prepilin-type N-terminal cleavage/methylation domain-containing protein